jgi:hypothetical protein
MLRLGMMTRCRCQVVGLAVRRFNPNLWMLMVVNLIDAMLPHSAQAAHCRHRLQQASQRPLIGFHDCRPCSRHENHSESVGHSGQRNPDFDLSYYYLVVTAIFLPAMLHHDS